MLIVRILKRWLDLGRPIGILLLGGFIVLRAWDPVPLEIVRLKTFDFYQTLKPRATSSGAVVVVDIDEKSLREYGQWPWPRTVIADLVARIAESKPAGIAFDVLFAEPDRLSPSRFIKTLRKIDEETRDKLAGMPDNEQFLAAAFAKARVVIGISGHHTALDPLAGELPRTAFGALGGDPKTHLFQYPGLLRNLPELERAAAGRGLFTIQGDHDGVIRRIPAVMVAAGALYPALSIELLRVAANAPSILIKRDAAGVRSIVVAGVEIHTDANAQLWPHFAPPDPKRFVSAGDLLTGAIALERLQGKLVLIGTSAVGLYDLRTTPLDRVRPGVDIHAELIDNILSGSLLTRPHYAIGAEIVLAVFVGLLMIVLVPLFGAMPVLIFGAVISGALLAASWYLFQSRGLLLDVGYPLASSLVIFVAMTFTNYLREEARRNQIRSAFQHYLSPELVDQLTREPDRLSLGGERRELSILFSDVRGFTTIAESYKADPAGLTQLMNRLLSPLSNAIIERRGTIDKYMGDAIMAFWNAPLDDPEHAAHACEAALAMQQCLKELNRHREQEDKTAGRPFIPMEIGIGISTGMAIVGNMGSDLRFDYSVLGDSVNLASRFESLTRVYGVPILLAADTAGRGGARFATLEIDKVRVKGKLEAERAFAVVGGEDVAADHRFQTSRRDFLLMLDAYRSKDWTQAAGLLATLRAADRRYGMDELFDLYADRISAFIESPPPADWDGTFDMTSK